MSCACRLLALIPAMLLFSLLPGCSKSDKDDSSPPFTLLDGNSEGRLLRFSDCSQVRLYLDELSRAQAILNGNRIDLVVGAPPGAEAPAQGTQGDTVAGGREFSSTNIQEAGVDEPDFVKTDGDFIYIVTGGKFVVVQGWPPERTAERARLDIEGAPLSLFVRGDTALVFSQTKGMAPEPSFFDAPYGQVTKLTLIDLADRSAPAVQREIFLEGAFRDARMVDGRVHLVTQSWLKNPAADPAQSPFPRRLEISPGAGSGVAQDICACEDVFRPDRPQGGGLLTITTLDLSPSAPLQSVSVLGQVEVMYAARESLYIAAAADDLWREWGVEFAEDREPRQKTAIHRFDLGAEPVYSATGEVPGRVLNQFSLGEHEGVLRIAATENWWWNGTGVGPFNRVLLLRQDGERLAEAGRLEGLGKPGESIFAVRFLADRGYVVTFQQIDPLYTLDLSDPAAPRVVGELEVPGVSTYLHPVGVDRLLAVGRNPAGGVDLSLFDIADFANPKLVDRISAGAGSYSEAQYDHKAFSYFPRQQVLALPVNAWSFDPFSGQVSELLNGLQVYQVDPVTGFTLRGTVDHAAFYREGEGRWYQPNTVRRSFFIGEAATGDFLYSIGDRGLKVSPFDDLSDAAVLPLPAAPVFWAIGPPVAMVLDR